MKYVLQDRLAQNVVVYPCEKKGRMTISAPEGPVDEKICLLASLTSCLVGITRLHARHL